MANVEDIFANLSAHMVEGLMVHDQMASYYKFLNLHSYAECHEEHYWEESKNYLCLKDYYLKHHKKLIKELPIANPKIIPANWYNYMKKDVDITTKRNAVKTGMEKWVKWETDTKNLYEQSYKDLMDLGEVADAIFLKKFIKAVTHELADIEEWYIIKQDSDFGMNAILADQE